MSAAADTAPHPRHSVHRDRAPPIEVKGLVSAFGDRVIHQDLDLTVRSGEVLGVVGGSGAGKSVLLNTIIGLKRPDGGDVESLGRRVTAAVVHAIFSIIMIDAIFALIFMEANL